MSDSAKTIIKYFCDRFLNVDYYPKSLKAILDFSIDKLKGLSKEDLKKFKQADINSLRDLSSLDTSKLKKIAKKTGLSFTTLQNSVISSLLIANAWTKRAAYIKKPQMKVVVAGLDFAGKTSLINRLISQQSYTNTASLEPTIGANIEEFESSQLNLIIWDLGGQKNHVQEYLEEPEKFFVQVDIMIFVFDVQDDKRYDDSVKYLSDLIKILEFLNEHPYILLLLNKVDPDIVNDPDFQIKLEYLTERITNVFLERDRNWTFEITPTSIYNFYSKEPEIAKSIKNIFTKETAPTEKNKELQIEEKLQRILDINLNLLDRVTTELAEIKRTINRLVPADISKSLFSVPFEKVPSDYLDETSRSKKSKKKKDPKKKTTKEDKIKKKDPITSSGVPKKLESVPKPKSLEKKEEGLEINQIKKEEILDKEEQLPPMAPKIITKINDLKPPPPPPKIEVKPEMSQENNNANNRKTVLLELKEMLKKRGIVR